MGATVTGSTFPGAAVGLSSTETATLWASGTLARPSDLREVPKLARGLSFSKSFCSCLSFSLKSRIRELTPADLRSSGRGILRACGMAGKDAFYGDGGCGGRKEEERSNDELRKGKGWAESGSERQQLNACQPTSQSASQPDYVRNSSQQHGWPFGIPPHAEGRACFDIWHASHTRRVGQPRPRPLGRKRTCTGRNWEHRPGLGAELQPNAFSPPSLTRQCITTPRAYRLTAKRGRPSFATQCAKHHGCSPTRHDSAPIPCKKKT